MNLTARTAPCLQSNAFSWLVGRVIPNRTEPNRTEPNRVVWPLVVHCLSLLSAVCLHLSIASLLFCYWLTVDISICVYDWSLCSVSATTRPTRPLIQCQPFAKHFNNSLINCKPVIVVPIGVMLDSSRGRVSDHLLFDSSVERIRAQSTTKCQLKRVLCIDFGLTHSKLTPNCKLQYRYSLFTIHYIGVHLQLITLAQHKTNRWPHRTVEPIIVLCLEVCLAYMTISCDTPMANDLRQWTTAALSGHPTDHRALPPSLYIDLCYLNCQFHWPLASFEINIVKLIIDVL